MGCASTKEVRVEEVILDATTLSHLFEALLDGPGAGCTIPKTEERAITLEQLRRVKQQIQQRCEAERWRDWQKKRLSPGDVSLYVICDKVIRPATEAKQTSFVELVAFGRQLPKWFASHWWGEPVFDFIACLEQHSRDHGYEKKDSETDEWKTDEVCAYWVCAYVRDAPVLRIKRALHSTPSPARCGSQ